MAKFTLILFFFFKSCNIWEEIATAKVNFPGMVTRDWDVYGCLGKVEDRTRKRELLEAG